MSVSKIEPINLDPTWGLYEGPSIVSFSPKFLNTEDRKKSPDLLNPLENNFDVLLRIIINEKNAQIESVLIDELRKRHRAFLSLSDPSNASNASIREKRTKEEDDTSVLELKKYTAMLPIPAIALLIFIKRVNMKYGIINNIENYAQEQYNIYTKYNKIYKELLIREIELRSSAAVRDGSITLKKEYDYDKDRKYIYAQYPDFKTDFVITNIIDSFRKLTETELNNLITDSPTGKILKSHEHFDATIGYRYMMHLIGNTIRKDFKKNIIKNEMEDTNITKKMTYYEEIIINMIISDDLTYFLDIPSDFTDAFKNFKFPFYNSAITNDQLALLFSLTMDTSPFTDESDSVSVIYDERSHWLSGNGSAYTYNELIKIYNFIRRMNNAKSSFFKREPQLSDSSDRSRYSRWTYGGFYEIKDDSIELEEPINGDVQKVSKFISEYINHRTYPNHDFTTDEYGMFYILVFYIICEFSAIEELEKTKILYELETIAHRIADATVKGLYLLIKNKLITINTAAAYIITTYGPKSRAYIEKVSVDFLYKFSHLNFLNAIYEQYCNFSPINNNWNGFYKSPSSIKRMFNEEENVKNRIAIDIFHKGGADLAGIILINMIKNNYNVENDAKINYLIDNANLGISLNGNTALYQACMRSDSNEIMNRILLKDRSTQNLLNTNGNTALHIAVEKNNIQFVRKLRNKYDPNKFAYTIVNEKDLVSFILKKNMIIEFIQNSDGNTPLHIAAKQNNKNMINELTFQYWVIGKERFRYYDKDFEEYKEYIQTHDTYGINIQNKEGNTPLHIVTKLRSFDNVERLMRYRATNSNLQNKEGDTPLHIATKMGDKNIVDTLLNNTSMDGVKRFRISDYMPFFEKIPNIKNNEGYTPLHIAVNTQNVEIVSLIITKLFELNITLDTLTKNGKTALQMAINKGNIPIAVKLVENGAKCCTENELILDQVHLGEKAVKAMNEALEKAQQIYLEKVAARTAAESTPEAKKAAEAEAAALAAAKAADEPAAKAKLEAEQLIKDKAMNNAARERQAENNATAKAKNLQQQRTQFSINNPMGKFSIKNPMKQKSAITPLPSKKPAITPLPSKKLATTSSPATNSGAGIGLPPPPNPPPTEPLNEGNSTTRSKRRYNGRSTRRYRR